MGASKSKEQDNEMADLDFSIDVEKLKFVKQIDDARYGQCKIFKSDKLDHLIAVTRSIIQRDSETELQKVQDSSQELALLEHDSIIKLLRHTVSKKSQLCNSFWTVNKFFEYVSNDLEQDIQRRRKEEVFYDESELWHIIVSVIAALAYLRSRGFEHGDIKPSSILLSEQGRVKLLPKPINSNSNNWNNYMQAFMGMKKAKYLSPILLKSLELQNQQPYHNCTKSDIFSLGLVILEAALLMEQDDIYDFVKFEINQQVLRSKIDFIKEKYSIQLAEFVEEMLIFDEIERPDIDILFAYIEELCRQGIQMADRIFSLGLKDKQPTYNYTNEDHHNTSQDYYDIRNEEHNNEKVKKSSNNNRFETPVKENNLTTGDIQDFDPNNQPKSYGVHLASTYVSNQKEVQPQNFVVNRQEKVRRSDWTLEENTDNNIYVGYGGASSTPIGAELQNSNVQKLYTFSENPSNVQKQVTFGTSSLLGGGASNTITTSTITAAPTYAPPPARVYNPLPYAELLYSGISPSKKSYQPNDYTTNTATAGVAGTTVTTSTTVGAPSSYVPLLYKDNYPYTSQITPAPMTTTNTYYSSTLPPYQYDQNINNLDSINKIITKYSNV